MLLAALTLQRRATGRRILVASLCCVMISGCGNNYQAPVTEASERQVLVPPEIVVSSRGEASRPARTSTAPATRNSTVSTPVASPARTPARSGSVHRVQPGETLFSIAFEYDLDFRSLAIANNLRPPYTIYVDQELRLDVSAVAAPSSSSGVSRNAAVTETGVVTTRAASGGGGVFRQPIGSQSAPNWQWPHRGAVLRDFSVGGNEGLDIAANVGDPVLAAGDGDVVYTGRGVPGVGNLIIIRHNDRYLSAYGHNSTILVAQGEHVTGGQKISEAGQNAAGVPMLHFEIREEGKSVNPGRLLPR